MKFTLLAPTKNHDHILGITQKYHKNSENVSLAFNCKKWENRSFQALFFIHLKKQKGISGNGRSR